MKQNCIRSRSTTLPIDALRSAEYEVVQFFVGHETLRDFLTFDNSATIELSKTLPLGLRGDAHRVMRATLAKALGNGRRRLALELPALIKKHFSILNRTGSHDLLNDACKPFVDACMCVLSGIELEANQCERLSDIFDPGASVSRRRKLEEMARNLMERDNSDSMKISLAIMAMGRDPLLGTMVHSMHHHFSSFLGKQLGAVRFDVVPADTAVPYIWREKTSGEGAHSLFECRLDQFVGQNADQRMNFFGVGRHTCLGKTHTLMIFDELSEFLAGCDLVMQRSHVVSTNHHVMKIPTQFIVELG